MSKYLTKLYQEVAKLRARIAELEARLLSFECGYCGEVLATPEEGQAHIRKCEKHPLHYATKHIAELEVEVEQWRAEKQDAENPSIRSMTRAEHLLMDNIGRVGALEADLSDRQTEIERLTNEVRILKARDEYALSELAMMECLHTEAGEPVFADRARAIRQTLMGAKDDIVLEEETDDECWRLESGSYFARGITSTAKGSWKNQR